MMMQKEREDIVRVGKLLYERGLVQLCGGNISVRGEGGRIAIKPSGMAYIDATPEDIVIIDMEGNVLEGSGKPSIETPMHTAIYKARPDINAIVHCHPPYAVAWSLKGKKCLHCVIVAMHMLGGAVMVAPYESAGSAGLARGAVEAIGERYACILQAHGVVAGSPKDVYHAMEQCFVVEDAAKISAVAESIPGETFYIDEQLACEAGAESPARIREADKA